MTNYGAIAILKALPENAPTRQLRVLIAVETFRVGADQWRAIGQPLLARTANISQSTVQRARRELIEAKHLEYQRGIGRGHLSLYRLLIADIKGGERSDHLSDDTKVVSEDAKGGQPPPVKVVTAESDIPNVDAGQTPDFGANGNHTALSAKAEALKAFGFSSAESAAAATPRAAAADPAPPSFEEVRRQLEAIRDEQRRQRKRQ